MRAPRNVVVRSDEGNMMTRHCSNVLKTDTMSFQDTVCCVLRKIEQIISTEGFYRLDNEYVQSIRCKRPYSER